MSFTKHDIITAVKNLELFLKIPQLKGAKVKLKPDGSLFTYSGGFNMVFQLDLESTKWAFRIWYVPIGEVKERYQSISKYLSTKKLSYFADFIYDEKGLVVNGVLLNTVHMEWLEGDLLKVYVEKNLKNKIKLTTLAENFLEMIKELRVHSISHGDLQEGNILIDNSGNIRLIDYDSVCIPEIEGQSELVTGLKGYQHPSRFRGSKASLKSDYFSELIIYITILALIEKPILWQKYQLSGTQYLLFTENDFDKLIESSIYKELKGLSEQIDTLLLILNGFLEEENYLNLDSFYNYLIKPEIKSFQLDKECIVEGDTVNLSWTINGLFSNATINNGTINVSKASSSIILHPQKSDTFTLTVFNELGTVFQKVGLKVVARIRVVKFVCLQQQLLPNSSTELIWKIENADSAKLNTGSEILRIPLEGSKFISPSKNQTYKLLITALDGETIIEETTSVTVIKPVAIKVFKPLHTTLLKGDSTQLTWKVENATELRILPSSHIVTSLSNLTVTPESTTTYILMAKNELHSISAECKVEVKRKPITWWKPVLVGVFILFVGLIGWYLNQYDDDQKKVKQIEALLKDGIEIAPDNFEEAARFFTQAVNLNNSLPMELKVSAIMQQASKFEEEGDKRCNLNLAGLRYIAENNYQLAAILTENPNPKNCK